MDDKMECPCCGQCTLPKDTIFEICPVCLWEDDDIQRDDPDYAGGANKMSLNEARIAWRLGHKVE